MDESNDLIESKWSHTDVSDLTGKKFYVCTSTIQEPFTTSRYSLIPCPSTGPKKIWCGTKCLGLAQNVYKFLVWPKKFGSAQNVLGPVEGRGISTYSFLIHRFQLTDCIMFYKQHYVGRIIFKIPYVKLQPSPPFCDYVMHECSLSKVKL